MDALSEITNDLSLRVNPERSRRFSSQDWERSLEILMELSSGEWLSSPAKRLTLVGSNGKGSTAFFLAFLLQKEIERRGEASPVGLYTSPHLLHFLERIRLDLQPVLPEKALEILNEIRVRSGAIYEDFTYFELLTLLAMRLFKNSGCGYEVYEAGLGGRLDATRMARSEVVILSTVSLEHTEILGDTREKILREKLAMVQPSTRLLVALHNDGIDDGTIQEIARTFHPGLRVAIYKDKTTTRSSYLEHNRRFAEFILEQAGFVGSPSREPFLPPGRMEERQLPIDSTHSIPCVYDTAHNDEAFRRALGDIRTRTDFPGEDQTLVCFAVLRDRKAKDAMRWIHSAGFQRLLRIEGEEFSDDPVEVPVVSGDDPGKFRQILDESNQRTPVKLCLILGSHRLYGLFRALTEESS